MDRKIERVSEDILSFSRAKRKTKPEELFQSYSLHPRRTILRSGSTSGFGLFVFVAWVKRWNKIGERGSVKLVNGTKVRRHNESSPLGHILQVLLQHTEPTYSSVLEIASGTGQHVSHFAAATPNLTWQPTDYESAGFASISAYTANLANVRSPVLLGKDFSVTLIWQMLPKKIGALQTILLTLSTIQTWSIFPLMKQPKDSLEGLRR